MPPLPGLAAAKPGIPIGLPRNIKDTGALEGGVLIGRTQVAHRAIGSRRHGRRAEHQDADDLSVSESEVYRAGGGRAGQGEDGNRRHRGAVIELQHARPADGDVARDAVAGAGIERAGRDERAAAIGIDAARGQDALPA